MTLLETILQSPSAPKLAADLAHALEDEARRRDEFRDWITPGVMAEFINGERVLHSPAKDQHNSAALNIATVFQVLVRARRVGKAGIENNMIGLTRNDYKPDVCWWGPEKAATISRDTEIFPPPDLAVEVLSPSTAKIDRGVKFVDYASHRVAEYWIVDPVAQVVEQYLLEGDRYELKFKAAEGVLTSAHIGGFSLPVSAVFNDAAHADFLASVWRA